MASGSDRAVALTRCLNLRPVTTIRSAFLIISLLNKSSSISLGFPSCEMELVFSTVITFSFSLMQATVIEEAPIQIPIVLICFSVSMSASPLGYGWDGWWDAGTGACLRIPLYRCCYYYTRIICFPQKICGILINTDQ